MEGIQLNVTVLLSPKLNKIVYHTLTVRFLHWDLMAWLGDLWVFLWDSQVAQCRRFKRWRFNPCFGKTLWRRKWHHTVVVLPGKSHGQRSLAGYSPWGHKSSDWAHLSIPCLRVMGVDSHHHLSTRYTQCTLTGHASQVNGVLSFIAAIFNSCYHSAKLLLLLLQMGIHWYD